jgi:hypothetical protein
VTLLVVTRRLAVGRGGYTRTSLTPTLSQREREDTVLSPAPQGR